MNTETSRSTSSPGPALPLDFHVLAVEGDVKMESIRRKTQSWLWTDTWTIRIFRMEMEKKHGSTWVKCPVRKYLQNYGVPMVSSCGLLIMVFLTCTWPKRAKCAWILSWRFNHFKAKLEGKKKLSMQIQDIRNEMSPRRQPNESKMDIGNGTDTKKHAIKLSLSYETF